MVQDHTVFKEVPQKHNDTLTNMGLSALSAQTKAPSPPPDFAFISCSHGSQSETPKAGRRATYWSIFTLVHIYSGTFHPSSLKPYSSSQSKSSMLSTKKCPCNNFLLPLLYQMSFSPIISLLSGKDCILWTSVNDLKALFLILKLKTQIF